ncbi:response regulator receiver domain [Mesorhizobium sp. M0036]|uniref:response regulator receiver domain n=1 Tax=Mesorhizobium sp. M0036 TaxID=2956853 RepID=UPI0033370196
MNVFQNFDDFRLEAIRQFAHTLIVVDDEAGSGSQEIATPPIEVRRPTRFDAAKPIPVAKVQPISHPLKADVLVETSMALGLICSVLKPRKSDKPAENVSKAAQKADILCVDWEMHRDKGKTALEIISSVLSSDESFGGRLRLIAIYTGVSDKDAILKKVLASIPKATRERRGIKLAENYLTSTDGLRVVWLLKKGGTYPPSLEKFAAAESELPVRLQKEFSYLSDGVLTNVAIATIASIRAATHNVIAKFNKNMDGPYFHHRGTVQNPEDAEEYATSIILSELKNAIDRNSIADEFAGKGALEKAISHALPDQDIVFGVDKDATNVKFTTYKDFIIDGIKPTIKKNLEAKTPLTKGHKFYAEHLATPLSPDEASSKKDMLKFAALTGLAAEAESSYSHHEPTLSLGTIVSDASGTYSLCVQASCDSVRLKKAQAFLFAQLEIVSEEEFQKNKEKIEFVVPRKPTSADLREFVCLKLSDKAPYAALRSIVFAPTRDEKVTAKKMKNGTFFFESVAVPTGKRAEKHRRYTWVADVKRRRALRTVQFIGQEMGRIGFDEFEAFRRKYD